MGEAILRTRPLEVISRYKYLEADEAAAYTPRRSVVLIDEVDKAPRDFPNDILNEIDQMFFRIPEIDNQKIEADDALLPIIVMTSNSENDLPDPFLRRCIYHHIRFPETDKLKTIIAGRLGSTAGSSDFYATALDLFYRLRDSKNQIRKKPATAELLDWITAIADATNGDANPLASDPTIARRTLSSLIKTTNDQRHAESIVDQWISEQS